MSGAITDIMLVSAETSGFTGLKSAVDLVDSKAERNRAALQQILDLGTVQTCRLLIEPHIAHSGATTWTVAETVLATVPIRTWLAEREPDETPALVEVKRLCDPGPLRSFDDIERLGDGMAARVQAAAELLLDEELGVTPAFCSFTATVLHNLDVMHVHLLACLSEATKEPCSSSEEVLAFYEQQSVRIEEERAALLPRTAVGGVASTHATMQDRAHELDAQLAAAMNRICELESELVAARCNATASAGKELMGGAAAASISVPPSVLTAMETEWLSAKIGEVSGRKPSSLLAVEPVFMASRDGFNNGAFLRALDSRQRALVIIYVAQNNMLCIFGAFTTAGFHHSGFTPDEAAFLFTLRNPQGIPPTAYMVDKPNKATFCKPDTTSMFGLGGGHDIRICNDCNVKTGSYTSFPHSYHDCTGHGYATFVGSKDGWLVADVHAYVV